MKIINTGKQNYPPFKLN